jgi:hypothetical protein
VPARGRSLCGTKLEHLGNPTNSPILVVKQKQATQLAQRKAMGLLKNTPIFISLEYIGIQ